MHRSSCLWKMLSQSNEMRLWDSIQLMFHPNFLARGLLQIDSRTVIQDSFPESGNPSKRWEKKKKKKRFHFSDRSFQQAFETLDCWIRKLWSFWTRNQNGCETRRSFELIFGTMTVNWRVDHLTTASMATTPRFKPPASLAAQRLQPATCNCCCCHTCSSTKLQGTAL